MSKQKKLKADWVIRRIRDGKRKPDTDRRVKDIMNSNSLRRSPKGQR